jgi:cell surface protein SprA
LRREWTALSLLSAAILVLWTSGGSAQGLSLERPYAGDFQALEDENQPVPLFGTGHPLPRLLTPATKLFRDTTIIDFEKRQVTIERRDSLGCIVWTHHFGELSEYLAGRARAAFLDVWLNNSLLSKSNAAQEQQQNIKLAWELPVQYPSWAQRVLGNEPPRLSISGSLQIKMAYEDIRQKESSAFQQSLSAGPGFNFQEQNQFTVTGTVGRLINVAISENSESDVNMNNPLKNFHIDYKESKAGELEDEIVQEVTAGYTGFSMPGTQLSGYSESHEGLFGIKITSRIGPLTLTTIASTEQGESQNISVSNSGKGGPGSTTTIKEDKFKTNKYFFLDTAYIRHYNKKYGLKGGDPGYKLPTGLEVTELQVWQWIYNQDAVKTILQNDPGRKIRDIVFDPVNKISYKFVQLQQDRHYRLYPKEGWIRFTDSVTINDPQDMIAIYLRTQGGSLQHGGNLSKDSLGIFIPDSLWVLKPNQYIDSLGADPAHFRLMWRSVYDIPGTVQDISKFILRVYHTGQDISDTVKNLDDGTFISDVMGLTRNATAITERQDIFNFDNKELVMPPYDTSASGMAPFANPLFGSVKGKNLRDMNVYLFGPNSTVMSAANGSYIPTFTIEMSGSSKQTVFDLGVGVMEKTVQVKADGRLLQPNVDYVLNTEIGKLELTSPGAKAADKIDINYQREALFMPDKKVFLGARAEIQLPFLSDKSLAGLSVLYQSTSINQDIPRIGQEPYSKLLFDFNTRLEFQPAWMTALVNKIPLVSTEAPSSATIDVEVAHSIMNPNTDKEAYVDDFESSKQVYSLGEGYKSWYRASPPFAGDSMLSYHPPAWDWYWFTPVYSDLANKVDRASVWEPDTGRVYTGMDKYETVLRLHVQPAPPTAPDASYLVPRFTQAWAGIMTPIPASMADRKRDQYFEILVNRKSGPGVKGRLRIQMGRMREDLCIDGAPPNGRPDREDTTQIWRESHDPNLDLGLDRRSDIDEKYLVPNGSGGWDTLKYDDAALGEEWRHDPAKDNNNHQYYTETNPGPYKYACRYEQDGWSNESEDINNDGVVDVNTPEQYHEFVIDLNDTASPYMDRSAKLVKGSGWYSYRIPLHEIIPGHPEIRRDMGLASDDWSNIRMVRLIWDGFDSSLTGLTQENQLMLDGMQFVGSQWEAVRDDSGRTKIDVSAINTSTDAVYDREVKTTSLVRRVIGATNLPEPEQSLRLNFHNLLPGDEAIAQRSFTYQPLNISSYDSMTLVVYGRDTTELPSLSALKTDSCKFVFRFGSDTSTYYEYRQKIMPKWDNYICVKLRPLSDLKLAWQTNHPGDSIDTISGTLHIKAPKGRQPNFANISWMAVGVVCSNNASPLGYAGEVWVDELKVVGIKVLSGWASRLNVQTQWADFMTFSAGFDYQGGDFRTMTDNTITMGDSRLSGNLNISTGLDKFMPKAWGFSIPVGGSITSSLTRPQLKPSTDVYLTDKNTNQPDGFLEMAKDVISRSSNTPTEAERFETQAFNRNIFINMSKANTSTNPAVDLLLQRLSTQFSYSMSANHTNFGRRPDSDSNYVDSTQTRTYSGSVNYDLSPRDPPRWTKWKPLGGNAVAWLPGKWKDLEFSLLPTKITFNLANATYTNSVVRQFDPSNNTLNHTNDFNVNHGVQIDFTPIRPILDLSYSLTVNRDFPNDSSLGNGGSVSHFIGSKFFSLDSNPTWSKYYMLQNERARSQNFKMTLNPQLCDWLTNSADYTANYSGTVTSWGSDSSKSFINAKVNSGLNFSSALTVGSLLQNASGNSTLGKISARIKKGCDFVGFNSLNFTYSTTDNLTNNFLGTDYLSNQNVGWSNLMAYQLGLGGRSFSDIISGNMNDRSSLGGMRNRTPLNDNYNYYQNDNRATNRTYQVSTSLKLSTPIDLSLSPISLQWSTRYSVRPDTTFYDTTRSFPEFHVGAQSSALNKVALISRYAQGVNLSSSFAVRKNTNVSSASGGTSVGTTYDLSPLVGVNGTLKKWPVSISYQHSLSSDKRESNGAATETTHDGDNVDMNYEVQKAAGASTTIKLFKWQIPIRGRTSMGMRFSRDHSTIVTAGETTSDVSNVSLTPHLSYIFTDNVTGTLEYTYSQATNNGATTTTNTAALIAEIKF